MDVRCEKCQTEYELDEGKLKPGGVTVKCTTCGHMFKVRGRATEPDQVSSGGVAPPIVPERTPTPRPTTASSSTSAARASSVLADVDDGERTWLVRLEDGEIKTCRELSTLQKWIVSGRVSRSCSISRTGKKWKLLGEIGELASFFGIADEAREARVSGQWQGSGSEESFVGAAPMRLDGNGHDGRGQSADGESQVGFAAASPAEMAAQAAASSSTAGSFVRTLPLGGAAALPPAARTPAPVRDDSHDAGQMAAQSAPSGHELAAESVRDDDEVAGDDEEETGDVSGAAAGGEPSALGHAPTLPPYGAGMLDDVPASGSGMAERSPSGLPLSPPPSRRSGTPAGPVTGGWAVQGQVQRGLGASRDSGRGGPTGGMARGGRAPDEAAFVGGGGRGVKPNMRGEFEAARYNPFADDEPLIPARNRSGLWIILFSLIVMAGAAGVVYLFLYTGGDDEEDAPVAQVADSGAGATVPAAATEPPAAAQPPQQPEQPGAAVEMEKLVQDAQTALLADSQEALEPLSQQLSALASGAGGASAASPAFLVVRARVETALAQQLADQAKLAASPADGKKLTEESRARAKTAHQLAEQALSLQADHAAALVAMADARRLEGERTVEIERTLRRVTQNPADAVVNRDADLVLALLRLRDDRLRDARVLLDKLVKAAPGGDVRPQFRLAWIDYIDANADAAVAGAESVLKAQPRHAGARALLDKLAGSARPKVETGDPMPPEDRQAAADPKPKDPKEPKEPAGSGKPAQGGAGEPADGGGRPKAGDTFDAVLERAEKLAENGNCGGAMPLYRKVLDMNPASVEALTGLGYCHLDRREFASAHARFRAALGISSRYQPAMWGIAEAYQRQGMKEQALERFEAFVAEHPTSPRAEAARQRIELLKREVGSSGGGGGGSEQGGGQQPPESGSGSGSGEQPRPSGSDGPIEPSESGGESTKSDSSGGGAGAPQGGL